MLLVLQGNKGVGVKFPEQKHYVTLERTWWICALSSGRYQPFSNSVGGKLTANIGQFKYYLHIQGAIQVLRTQWGWVGVSFPGKKRYQGVRFNVISITRGWGSNFQEKKRYITLEWYPKVCGSHRQPGKIPLQLEASQLHKTKMQQNG